MQEYEKFVKDSNATYYEALPSADKPIRNTNRAFGVFIKYAIMAGIACSIAVSAPSEAHAQGFLDRLLGNGQQQQQVNPYYQGQQGYQQGPQQGWGNPQPRYVQQQYQGQGQYIRKTPAAAEIDRMVDENAIRLKEAGAAFRRQGIPVCLHIKAVRVRINGVFYSVQSDDCRAIDASNRRHNTPQGQYEAQRTAEEHQRQASVAGVRYDPIFDKEILNGIKVLPFDQAVEIQHQLNQANVDRMGR